MKFKINSKYLKCSFISLKDFFLLVNPKRLITTIKTKKEYIKRGDKRDLMRFIYRQHLINVLNDCIDNRITYVYNTKLKNYSIQCEQLPDDMAIKYYKSKRMYNWEPINSYNKAYGLTMTIEYGGVIRKKIIRNKELDKKIIENTNNGKRW